MKTTLLLIALIFTINIGYSQNTHKTYKKRELTNIIDRYETLLTKKETVKDSVQKGELYIKYSITAHTDYKTKVIRELELTLDSKIELVKEFYYFDEEGFLIYVTIEEYRYSTLVSVVEIKLYGQDRISFFDDGSRTFFNKKDSDTILKLIGEDIIYYKTYFKKEYK